jgi:hypothetical protein
MQEQAGNLFQVVSVFKLDERAPRAPQVALPASAQRLALTS